jgi:hypothetical protein
MRSFPVFYYILRRQYLFPDLEPHFPLSYTASVAILCCYLCVQLFRKELCGEKHSVVGALEERHF